MFFFFIYGLLDWRALILAVLNTLAIVIRLLQNEMLLTLAYQTITKKYVIKSSMLSNAAIRFRFYR